MLKIPGSGILAVPCTAHLLVTTRYRVSLMIIFLDVLLSRSRVSIGSGRLWNDNLSDSALEDADMNRTRNPHRTYTVAGSSTLCYRRRLWQWLASTRCGWLTAYRV